MALPRFSRVSQAQCRSCSRNVSLLLSSTHFNLPATTTRTTVSSGLPSSTRRYSGPRESPTARQTAKYYGRSKPTVNYQGHVERYDRLLTKFETERMMIYQDAKRYGAIDPNMSLNTFTEIGRRLIKQAFATQPTKEAVKKVYSGDINRVYEVGNAISAMNPWAHFLKAWLEIASLKAGATVPLVMGVLRVIEKYKQAMEVNRDMDSETLKKMIKLAREERQPLARRGMAEWLFNSDQVDEAIKELRELVEETYPSNTQPTPREDITVDNRVTPPWQFLAEVYNSQGAFDKADEMMKLGALYYRDSTALVAYAYLRREQEDWLAYEQCLVVAATSTSKSSGEACFRLANYYYNIYKGKAPSRDEITIKSRSWFTAPIHKLFNRSRKREDYRTIAMDWYEAAVMRDYHPARRNWAVLLRQDGHYKLAEQVLAELESDSQIWNSKNIIKLRTLFYDTKFQPELPASWIVL